MKNFSNNIQNKKDKLLGQTKVMVGKATNNKELELKGRFQSAKADINEKVSDIKDNKVKEGNES